MGVPQQRDQRNSEEKLEQRKYVYELVNSWIENTDNKVSVSCGVFSGVFGVITFLSDRITPSATISACWRTVYHWSFVLSFGVLLLSILFYVLAVTPNLGKSGKKKNGKNLRKQYPVFFGDIAEMTAEEYKTTMNKATDRELIIELQDETYYNSGVCYSKMRKYRIGLWLSFSAVVLAIISLASRILMYC